MNRDLYDYIPGLPDPKPDRRNAEGDWLWDRGQEPWKRLRLQVRWNDQYPLSSFRYVTRTNDPYLPVDDLPDLIWCKIYNSHFENRDILFFAAFLYQNSQYFVNPEHLFKALRYINNHFSVRNERLIMHKLIYLESLRGDDLCKYFAYDINERHVRDLQKHDRHVYADHVVHGAFVPNDPCRFYTQEYNDRYVNVNLLYESDVDSIRIGSEDSYESPWTSPPTPRDVRDAEDIIEFPLVREQYAQPFFWPSPPRPLPNLPSDSEDEDVFVPPVAKRCHVDDFDYRELLFMIDETSVPDAVLAASYDSDD